MKPERNRVLASFHCTATLLVETLLIAHHVAELVFGVFRVRIVVDRVFDDPGASVLDTAMTPGANARDTVQERLALRTPILDRGPHGSLKETTYFARSEPVGILFANLGVGFDAPISHERKQILWTQRSKDMIGSLYIPLGHTDRSSCVW